MSANDLSSWNFAGKNLTDAEFRYATLTDADFTQANLTDADFYRATLTDADLTGATIAGADFQYTTGVGFTRTQFESTASYASGDLAGVRLYHNDLSSWNFAGKNLAGADFWYATLTDADFTGADLTGASFHSTTLTDADFTGATIAGANFEGTTSGGFTRAQFESTASYASGDLAGVRLSYNDLSSWNFAGKNLTDAEFWYATLVNADFTGADARGASNFSYIATASLRHFVKPDGQVTDGLNVAAGEQFRVWDYDGQDTDGDDVPDTPLGITVLDEFVIDDASLLIVGLEDDDWGSTIAFGAGIGVAFDGTLEVELRNGFMPIVGDQWQLFDFAGVTPTGGFDAFVLPTLAGGMQWDTANLMNTGVLAVVVPEPTSLLIMAGALTATTLRRRR